MLLAELSLGILPTSMIKLVVPGPEQNSGAKGWKNLAEFQVVKGAELLSVLPVQLQPAKLAKLLSMR